MEACYINTGHPDFLNGHKAIALVTERLTNKQAQAAADPKASKNQLAALQTNNLSTPNVDSDGNSFFGSFFAGAKKSKKSNMMETVSTIELAGSVFRGNAVLTTFPYYSLLQSSRLRETFQKEK